MVKQFIHRPALWISLASLLVLMFALSACGGDSGSSSTTTTSSGSAATSSSGAATGGNASSAAAQTVNVRESKAAGRPDVYKCDPTTLTIKKGDSVQFTNLTDEIQDFDQGDGQKAGIDDLRLALNQSSAVTFNTTGTFILTSEKGASITVIVQ